MSEKVLNIWPEWKIEKILGKGSFGQVYQAIRTDNDITSCSAIKVISIPQDESEVLSIRSEGLTMDSMRTYFKGIVDDFVNEIRVMESFKGVPNIVSVEDYKIVEHTEEIGWDIYIRMELLTPFTEFLLTHKMSEQDVAKLGCDICNALELCAQKNIIHRDIKPENIFVNEFGHFKLGDFGISRKMENLTSGLSQKGTYNYMAPEVFHGSEYDARVDIYSLGIVLYRLMNENRLPFLMNEKQLMDPNERKAALDRRLKGETLPPPCEASPKMASIILTACASEPSKRFTKAAAMKAALASIVGDDYRPPVVAPLPTAISEETDADKTTSVRKATEEAEKTTSVRKASEATVDEKDNKETKNTFGKKKAKWPWILLIILLLGAAGVGSVIIYSKVMEAISEDEEENRKEEDTEEEKNIEDEGSEDNASGDDKDTSTSLLDTPPPIPKPDTPTPSVKADRILMPKVEGMAIDEALALLQDLSDDFIITWQSAPHLLPKDQVLSQTPKEGTLIAPDGKIVLVRGLGIPTTTPTPSHTVTPNPTVTPIPEFTKTIKDVYGNYGVKAGTCMSSYMLRDAQNTDFIKENFNSITFEQELKPEYILDQEASKASGELVVKFSSYTENMLKWCKDNNMAVRGHTIIWHSQTPQWIFYDNFDTNGNLVGREVMLARMESYIKQLFELLEEKGYLDMFYAYDIVNEAWLEDGSKRPGLWLSTIGDDYIWQAFYFADKYAPEHVDLYYNDFNEHFKTDILYDFVQTLKDEDGSYLIDGIGFQAHLYTKDSLEEYFTHMEKMATLGLKLSITELDVSLGTFANIDSATDQNLKLQGQFYYNLISGIMERVQAGTVKMDVLTFYGFVDKLSWRSEYSPLLLDRNWQPKYAYGGALLLKEYAGFDEEVENSTETSKEIRAQREKDVLMIEDLIIQYKNACIAHDIKTLERCVTDAEYLNMEYIDARYAATESVDVVDLLVKEGINEIDYVTFVLFDENIVFSDVAAPSLECYYIQMDPDTGKPLIFMGVMSNSTEAHCNQLVESEEIQELIAKTEVKFQEALKADRGLEEFYKALK